MITRPFDAVGAVIGLLVLSPIIGIALLLSWISTREQPIFRQVRTGRGGQPFTVFKIRTMRAGATSSLSVIETGRVTRIGAVLRRFKLDELLQLINVVRGDMALVGPRPDVPAYSDQLMRQHPNVLSVRPGVTSPASVLLQDEEVMLAQVADPRRLYDEHVWPAKIRLNEEYVERRCFTYDVVWIMRTLLPLDWQPSLKRRRADLLDEMMGAYHREGIDL